MQTTALPIPFYRAASNSTPEVSQTATDRLKLLEQWRAIRAEGATAFEEACRERGVLLFVLPPHSPKLNGYAGAGRMSRSSTTSTMGS